MTVAAASSALGRTAERHRCLQAQGLLWRRGDVALRGCRRGLVAFLTRDRFIGTALQHKGEVTERDFSLLHQAMGLPRALGEAASELKLPLGRAGASVEVHPPPHVEVRWLE